MISLMLRAIKINQLTKYSWTFGQLFPGPRMTPKRAIVYLLKCMAQLLPNNRLSLCGAQKTRADKKKSGTYLKSAGPKRIVSLPHKVHGSNFARWSSLMFKMIKIHQLSKKSGANLWSAFSWVEDDLKKGHSLSL